MDRQEPITIAQIRARAYELWDRNHRPEGYEVAFWLMAERELRAERAGREGLRKQGTSPGDEPAEPGGS